MNLTIIYTSEDKYIAPIFYRTSCYRVYFYWSIGASINLTPELELERHQEPRKTVDLDNESRRPLLCLST